MFGESQSRVVVSVDPSKIAEVQKLASEFGLPATHIGTVTDKNIVVNGEQFANYGEITDIYNNAIANKLNA